jgi:hypothetical protein
MIAFFFCRAKPEVATNLMSALKDYQRAFGQQINLNKSEMTFSPNLHQNIKQGFQTIMPIQMTDSISKYLGMPTTMGRTKMQDFNFMMDRVWNKLKGWKEMNLSFAGRSVLISAVIQAILTYMMSCFLIPKGICYKIESSICKFWWGSKDSNHKIHWKAKAELFKPKFNGGLGFRYMHLFNLAMLAKQGWKAKYCPNHDVLHAQAGNIPSYTWMSIHQALNTLKKGRCWILGGMQSVELE